MVSISFIRERSVVKIRPRRTISFVIRPIGRFRFIRGRGELRTQVARPDEPYNWEELTLLWNPMATAGGTPPSAFRQLGDLLTRFETCWDRLVARLAHPN
jgi:hypothetical protein